MTYADVKWCKRIRTKRPGDCIIKKLWEVQWNTM